MKTIEFWRKRKADAEAKRKKAEFLLQRLKNDRRGPCKLDSISRTSLDLHIAELEGLVRKYKRAEAYHEERVLELQSRFSKVLRGHPS